MEAVVAYIDPGAGSLIIQAVIAGLVAVPIFFRTQIGRVVRAVRRTGTDRPDKTVPADDAAPGA